MTSTWTSGRRLRESSTAFLLIAGASSLTLGYLAAFEEPSSASILIMAIAFSLLLPIALRRRSVREAWLEPIVWANLALFAMFVIRPAAIMLEGEFGFAGYDLSFGFAETLFTAWIGVLALNLGYFLAPAVNSASSWAPPPSTARDSSVITFAAVCAVGGVAAYSFVAAKNGVSIQEVFKTGLVQNPDATSAYLYMAPFALLPASLALFNLGDKRKSTSLRLIAVGFALFAVAIIAPSGDRFATLLFVAPFGVYLALKHRMKAKVVPSVLVLITLLTFVIATQNFRPGEQGFADVFRSSASALARPVDSIKHLALGPTLEMFDGFVIEHRVVDNQLGHEPGIFLTTAITHPVPRTIWAGKPYAPDGVVNESVFAGRGVRASDASLAYSVMGGMYLDSGRFGVMIGMLGLGFAFRLAWVYLLANRTNEVVLMTYSMLLPLIVVLMRGNLPDTFGRAFFTLLPIPFFYWAAASRERRAIGSDSRGVSARQEV